MYYYYYNSVCVYTCFSLSVRPWDDVLLVSVLKGQNVSGIRKDKGKKDVLIEQISVVLLRTEVLQRQHRYKKTFTLIYCKDTHTHTLLKLLIKPNLAVLLTSAGTENCVATYESSRLMTPNCECSSNHKYLMY